MKRFYFKVSRGSERVDTDIGNPLVYSYSSRAWFTDVTGLPLYDSGWTKFCVFFAPPVSCSDNTETTSEDSLETRPAIPGIPVAVGSGKSSPTSQQVLGADEGKEQPEERHNAFDLDETIDRVGATDTGGSSEGGSNVSTTDDQEEPGLWGPDGLLSTPNVGIVLLLACMVQVRIDRVHKWLSGFRSEAMFVLPCGGL